MRQTIWAGVFVLCCITLIVYILHTGPTYTASHKPTCDEMTKVMQILEVHYRGATVLLKNGKTVDVYQATLKPGDDYCMNWTQGKE